MKIKNVLLLLLVVLSLTFLGCKNPLNSTIAEDDQLNAIMQLRSELYDQQKTKLEDLKIQYKKATLEEKKVINNEINSIYDELNSSISKKYPDYRSWNPNSNIDSSRTIVWDQYYGEGFPDLSQYSQYSTKHLDFERGDVDENWKEVFSVCIYGLKEIDNEYYNQCFVYVVIGDLWEWENEFCNDIYGNDLEAWNSNTIYYSNAFGDKYNVDSITVFMADETNTSSDVGPGEPWMPTDKAETVSYAVPRCWGFSSEPTTYSQEGDVTYQRSVFELYYKIYNSCFEGSSTYIDETVSVIEPDYPIDEPKPELNEHYYGDFNGDGITDVFKKGYDAYRALYISDGTSYSEVFFGDEDGLGGTDSETFFTSKDAIIYPGDYNGDGKSDLFVKGYGTYRALYLSLGTSFDRVFLGTKDAVGGTDSETFFTSKDSIIYPGDYNGDGKSDLFVKGYGTYRALYLSLGTSFDRVFLGTKDAVGGTDSETFFTSKDSIIYPDDYNNDGKTDLLVKGYGAYEALYLSQGTWFLRSYLKK